MGKELGMCQKNKPGNETALQKRQKVEVKDLRIFVRRRESSISLRDGSYSRLCK